jgi:hypothetical protein
LRGFAAYLEDRPMTESPDMHTQAETDRPQAGGPRPLRDTTRDLINAVLLDVWPRAGAIVDFGLDSQEHFEALYYPLRHGEITPEQVDAALGDGAKLTELVSAAPHNPHKGIVFHTSWDALRADPAYGEPVMVAVLPGDQGVPLPGDIARDDTPSLPAADHGLDTGRGR